MPIKFRPKKELKLKEIIIRRITDPGNPYTKPKPVIELNKAFSGVSQRMFAGAIAKSTYVMKRTTNPFKGKAKRKLKFTAGREAINTERAVKQSTKNLYENTGDVVSDSINKGVGYLSAKPGLTTAFAATQVGSKVGSIAAALTGNPLLMGIVANPAVPGVGTITAPMFLRGYKNMNMTQKRRLVKGKQAAEKVTNWMKGRSIKNTVEKGKRVTKSLLAPINPNYNPSYQLKRATI